MKETSVKPQVSHEIPPEVETIVYLPVPRKVEGEGLEMFTSYEVYDALTAAGVDFTQETPTEHKIRMLEDKVNDLKELCAKLLDENYRLKSGLPK